MVVRQALFHLSQETHLKSFATGNAYARSMALRFVAGESFADAATTVAQINRQGMSATLDHLGENVTTRADAEQATEDCIAALVGIRERNIECNLSVKMTQFGLDVDGGLSEANLARVLRQASELETFVRVDMEGSAYTERTLDAVFRAHDQFPNVGTVIQSCLYRSAGDIDRLVDAGIRVRLVKGAYLEPTSVAYPEKVDVDANYVRLMRVLLDRGQYPALATHDPAMIDATRRYAEEHGIHRSQFEFQMLFGVRRDLQDALANEGFRVRVYVPYGTQWYAYFMRRLAERPANVMFVLGSIAREVTARRSRS
jgi:proline dehydrogenase